MIKRIPVKIVRTPVKLPKYVTGKDYIDYCIATEEHLIFLAYIDEYHVQVNSLSSYEDKNLIAYCNVSKARERLNAKYLQKGVVRNKNVVREVWQRR